MPTLNYACERCDGSGVYMGMAEPAGHAVICVHCNGTGKAEFKYQEFTTRKVRKGIRQVSYSRGTLLVTGVGPAGPSITYDEFLAGKMPPKP